MKLSLSFGQEGGASRGGVDVWLQVELTADGDPRFPETRDGAAEAAGEAFDEWLAGAGSEEGSAVHGVWAEDGEVRTEESEHYDFGVRRPVGEVRDAVRWLARTGLRSGSPGWDARRGLLEGEWTYSLRTKVYSLRAELFREGNAD